MNHKSIMNQSPRINIVVALDAEAQPLIHSYKLRRNHDIYPFALYGSDEKQLIVSGIGKYNATVATGYLAGLSAAGPQVWLNIGIAGGNVANYGETVLANAILDQETNRRYYPSICFDTDLPQTEIVTVNTPSSHYKKYVLYDMEAAGFFGAASHFSTSELIHCCKIISDNSDQKMGDVTKESASALIDSNFEKIDKIIQTLAKSISNIIPDDGVSVAVSHLGNKYHFTTAQQNSLKILVQNWVALNVVTDFSVIYGLDAKNSKQYLEELSRLINSKTVNY